MFGHIPQHLPGEVRQLAFHVNVAVQVNAHHRFQLPQGQDDGTFGIIDIRNGVCHRRFGAGKIQFGSLLGIVTPLGLLEIGHRILIDLLIYIESFLGQQDAKERLLHLGHHLQTGRPRLLYGQFYLLPGDFEALPQLGVHQGHCCSNAGAVGIPSAHFNSAGRQPGRGIALGNRDFLARGSLQCVKNRLHHAGKHIATAHAIHIHHLFLDGALIASGSVYLREQLGVSTFF